MMNDYSRVFGIGTLRRQNARLDAVIAPFWILGPKRAELRHILLRIASRHRRIARGTTTDGLIDEVRRRDDLEPLIRLRLGMDPMTLSQ